MDKIRNGKWTGCIVPLGVLLRLFSVITAQPGFLSISCGGKTNYTAENNITWVTDAAYIDVGEAADIGDTSALGSYLHSLRYFPKPLNRSCYKLPVAPNVPHLVRLWFVLGNFSGYPQDASFSFSIQTLEMFSAQNIEISTYPNQSYYEYIFVTSGRVLYVCLFRTWSNDDPFISSIELRRLQHGMYHDAKPGTPLFIYSRYDIGGNSVVRYPQDKFDRIWIPLESASISRNVSVKEPISTANTKDLPPAAVMQTAWVTTPQTNPFSLAPTFSFTGNPLLVLYFADIETMNMSESRSFNVRLDGKNDSETITLMHKYSAREVTIAFEYGMEREHTFELVETSNSTLPPIINAYEYYSQAGNDNVTYTQDVDALHAVKRRFQISDWISDPCYMIPWNGIGCDDTTLPNRISEMRRKIRSGLCAITAHQTALKNKHGREGKYQPQHLSVLGFSTTDSRNTAKDQICSLCTADSVRELRRLMDKL